MVLLLLQCHIQLTPNNEEDMYMGWNLHPSQGLEKGVCTYIKFSTFERLKKINYPLKNKIAHQVT